MKILIQINILDEEGNIIAKKESFTFESAMENLAELESYIERQEANAELLHEAEMEGN